MSLTFKDYKINHIALLLIKVLTLSQKQVKIQKFSAFNQSNLLLDQSKNEEIHHYASASFSSFSIPVQSIKINIQSIERNSWSIETMKNFIMEFLLELIGSRFLFDQLKRTFDRSKGILDRLRQWRISSWSFCLNQSVVNCSLINRKEHSIDRKEFSIDRTSHN